MSPLQQLLKSVNNQSGIKSKLKGLIGKSTSSLFCSEPVTNHTSVAGGLLSSSFRTFQCGMSKISSRAWEVHDCERPLSVSEAASRVFATPSVHGPMWQILSYHSHQLFDKSPVEDSRSCAKLVLECQIGRGRKANLDAKLVVALDLQSEGSASALSLWPKLWNHIKKPVPEDHAWIISHEQMELDQPPKLEWGAESDDARRDNQDSSEFDLQISNFKSTTSDFLNFCAEMCCSAISFSFWSVIYRELKQGGLLLDTSPEFPLGETRTFARGVNSKGLRLLSGACYFPHPEKEVTGGEDAYFICPEKQVFGVADGVGGWADMGVDSGAYARQLMSESMMAAQEEPTGCVDAARVLKKAYSKTTCRGSSTACILALSDYGLQAVNLGDSGFLVVRNGQMIFKSPVQQHNFNYPFQLESFGSGDPLSAAELFVVEVAAGDVIITGTDGLFDNLYVAEMETIVLQATWCGTSPDITAQQIACLARERANDCNRQTPFSAAAQSAGYSFSGGKMDDITVIVSYVTDPYVINGQSILL